MSSTRRLADEHRLEAPLERRVLLDVLAVLVERRRADRAQLAAGEHRLEHVAGVHRALGGARADDRVQLVDEHDDLTLGVGDLLQHGLQPVLELAAVLRAGDHRAQVERDHAAVLAAPRARRRRRSAGRGPRRSRSCRRRARRSAPGCSSCGGCRTWITRRISSSRPITGSSLPCAAASVRSRPYFSSAWNLSSGFWSVTRCEPRTSSSALSSCVVRGAGGAQRVARRAGVARPARAAGARSRRTRPSARASRSRRRAGSGSARPSRRRARGRRAGQRRQRVERRRERLAHGRRVDAELAQHRRDEPPSCSSSTASRCSGVVCGLRRSSASRWAAWSASCDLIVNRSGCIVFLASKSKSV